MVLLKMTVGVKFNYIKIILLIVINYFDLKVFYFFLFNQQFYQVF